MRAIVTVVGKDRVGIIANVCNLLAKYQRQRPGHQPDRLAGVFHHDHDGGCHPL